MLGLPGGGLTVGGGGLGVVGVVIYLLFAVLSGGTGLGGPLGNLDGSTVSQAPPGQVLGQDCQTGADANRREDCRIVGDVNSVQAYWTARSPRRATVRPGGDGLLHRVVEHRLRRRRRRMSGPSTAPSTSTSTSTSASSTSSGRSFGARGGPFAQAYVLAHEYGHHVQDLLGALDARARRRRARRAARSGPSSRPTATPASGRTTRRRPATSSPHPRPISPMPWTQPRPSATTGSRRRRRARSNPETWTHGSSAQRQHWFKRRLRERAIPPPATRSTRGSDV